MNSFANKLSELIAESGKTQNEICKDLDIYKQKLSRWKTGNTEPTLDDLIMLSNYFDVSVDYLIGANDEHSINRK